MRNQPDDKAEPELRIMGRFCLRLDQLRSDDVSCRQVSYQPHLENVLAWIFRGLLLTDAISNKDGRGCEALFRMPGHV